MCKQDIYINALRGVHNQEHNITVRCTLFFVRFIILQMLRGSVPDKCDVKKPEKNSE